MHSSVIAVTALEGTRLRLKFADGAEGEVSVTDLVPLCGVFAPLADRETFRQVRVNAEMGTICWPNGADLDPHVLYSRITGAPLPGQTG